MILIGFGIQALVVVGLLILVLKEQIILRLANFFVRLLHKLHLIKDVEKRLASVEKMTADDALELGMIMIRRAKECVGKPAAVRVITGGQTTFSFLMEGNDPIKALSAVLCGGVMIGAIFMATDYVTSPPTPWGKVIFGIGCGLLTCLIRYFGNLPEGVSYAILFMNILNPYIMKWTKRKDFGTGGAK